MSFSFSLRVNDIFDELIAENKRLLNQLLFSNKCLNVLIEIKYNFNSIIDELKTNLSSNQLKTIEDLEMKYKNVMKGKELNEMIDRRKRYEENDCKTSDECFQSLNIGSNDQKNELKTRIGSNSEDKHKLKTNTNRNTRNKRLKTNPKNSLNESIDSEIDCFELKNIESNDRKRKTRSDLRNRSFNTEKT